VRRSLEKREVELRIIGTGAAVLDAYIGVDDENRWDPDIILLDLNLPGISGKNLLPRLREEIPRWVPIVVFSSSSELKDAVGCYEAGCNTFITKPTDFDDFESAIDGILRYLLDLADV
jgi:two-component system response regulator